MNTLTIVTIVLNILMVKSYEASWDNLDLRVTPEWYDKAKFGIMIHFGVYSASEIGSEWFWYAWKKENLSNIIEFMEATRPSNFTYQDLAKEFKANLFDPEKWIDLFSNAGARYVVITAKHHDGFTLYPSTYSEDWNSVDIGPHLDILDEIKKAMKKTSMKFGIYYSLMEWFHPLYEKDRIENTSLFVDHKVLPELKEIVELYEPDIIWSDGDWEMSDSYWKSKEFLTWLFAESSVQSSVVVNDRWGEGSLCNHGSFLTCRDRFNPRKLQEKKFENVLSMDKKSWGYDSMSTPNEILTVHEIIEELVTTVACNGNLLLNIGPKGNGRIDNIFIERLEKFGFWLMINGEGIFGTKPWWKQNENENIWFTTKIRGNFEEIFIFVLKYPDDGMIEISNILDIMTSETEISLLGFTKKIGVNIQLKSLFLP